VKGRNGGQDFIDLALIPPSGALIGRRVMLSLNALRDQLRNLYSALARQQPMVVTDPSSASRQLYRLLIEPLSADFVHLGITTLILVPDVSLQAVPFSALHDGQQSFGERYAFSVTPSVSLMRQDFEPEAEGQKQLAFGASQFKGLAPLPLVPQEVERIAANGRGELFLNSSFTPDALINRVADPRVRRVHLATHAEFLPGGPSSSRLYTGSGSMDLSRFAALRQRRPGNPLDLFVLSACRTALGDPSSELGFAGLALQAGALSAIGTLWYVDDVATSAFFVQFYRFLDQGLPKAEALQATRRGFAKGLVRLQGDQVIGVDGRPLIDSLTPQQQRRVAEGLQHPFFWSGITLLGTPW
jgi:CHAT domain-containing protein